MIGVKLSNNCEIRCAIQIRGIQIEDLDFENCIRSPNFKDRFNEEAIELSSLIDSDSMGTDDDEKLVSPTAAAAVVVVVCHNIIIDKTRRD